MLIRRPDRQRGVLGSAEVSVLREGVRSFGRIADDYSSVAESLDSEETSRAITRVTKPASLTGMMRSTGIALALAPEPVTTVAGVALVAASFAAKGREPASLSTLRDEALAGFDGLESLRDELSSLTL